MKAEIVRKKGKSVLADPIFNKGLGHPRSERDRLSIRGLLPSQVHLYFFYLIERPQSNRLFYDSDIVRTN